MTFFIIYYLRNYNTNPEAKAKQHRGKSNPTQRQNYIDEERADDTESDDDDSEATPWSSDLYIFYFY